MTTLLAAIGVATGGMFSIGVILMVLLLLSTEGALQGRCFFPGLFCIVSAYGYATFRCCRSHSQNSPHHRLA